MTRADHWTKALTDWRTTKAMPLWSLAGVDPATGTAWEALDHYGYPLMHRNRRQRVQFRQAYVFGNNAGMHALGWQIFRHVMDHGFDPDTGLFAAWVAPDLTRLDQTHDLYDLAFGLLAAATLGQAGFNVAADIARLEQATALLHAPTGWHETPLHRQPRRQNPHMHLFEAATALYAYTGAPSHLAMAQRCLDLIATYALHPNGTLQELFDPEWVPWTTPHQPVEPGHLAEWIYLSDSFSRVTGTATGLPLDQMWQTVLGHRLPSGFLPDVVGQTSRRLWPQSELLKAATVMQRAGTPLPHGTQPAQIAQQLWAGYLNPPVAGGWFDCFEDQTGALVSTDMPASTLYHIDLAIDACLTVPDAPAA